MDLLTKEQAAKVERMRARDKAQRMPMTEEESHYADLDRRALLSILDEAVKTFNAYSTLSEAVRSLHRQYTESELADFIMAHHPEHWQGLSGDYFQRGVIACARHFGLLKE